ncbi:hypothetical protein MSM1_05805 [Mycobacterium sp. SM1]|uniref:DUF6632 domain-containing protein n=1 Tax=Mycobacterium sp. SM1 TaxID=2816243 RepID=UPI001BD14873|nr:DUF6632 domain-containing protein [Mycobacterium sp. SM1]MBS4727880.1 hypothetical protein [Mycobacterium sp. SM1]
MSEGRKGARALAPLRVALLVIGLFFIFGIYAQGQMRPSGWRWGHGHSHYPLMLLGIYVTLGVFLIVAARNPLAHRSLIWFTAVSSLVHGGVMAVEAVVDTTERAHFTGDVPTFLVIGVVLGWLMVRAELPRPAKTPT